jgi:hypothetical protein
MPMVPTIRPTDDQAGGAKVLLTVAALLTTAWAATSSIACEATLRGRSLTARFPIAA